MARSKGSNKAGAVFGIGMALSGMFGSPSVERDHTNAKNARSKARSAKIVRDVGVSSRNHNRSGKRK